MKFDVLRRGFQIEPQSEMDIAFIEEVLGLKRADDFCILRRQNAMGLSCIAYLETSIAPVVQVVEVEEILDPTELLLINAVKEKSWNEAAVLALLLSDLAENREKDLKSA